MARLARGSVAWIHLALGCSDRCDSQAGDRCDSQAGLAWQLAGGNTDAGRLEVWLDGSWRHVCARDWTMSEAEVVCRSLGFATAFGAPRAFGAPAGSLPGVAELSCHGNESSLAECEIRFVGHDGAGCEPLQAVGAACLSSPPDPSAAGRGAAQVEQWQKSRQERRQQVRKEWMLGSELPDVPVTCHIRAEVPTPFSSEHLQSAYVFGDRIKADFLGMEQRLLSHLCAEGSGVRLQAALANLVQRGLQWDSLGMDLTSVNASDSELALLEELYFSHDLFGDLHLRLDEPLRRQRRAAQPEHAGNEILDRLQLDGFAPVQDFGLSEVALDELTAQAEELLAGKTSAAVSVTSGGEVVTARVPLPALEPLLANATLHQALRGYLGPEVTLEGYKITRLDTKVVEDVNSYVSAMWHHDRAGRRIKLFLYLHDIDCEYGHPTRVALGSHQRLFYRTEEFPHSRFRDEFVTRTWTEALGCGRRGGGFLFDTHSVHKGTPQGRQPRTTVIVEFHSAAKCPAVAAMGLPIPCPSGDQLLVRRSLSE